MSAAQLQPEPQEAAFDAAAIPATASSWKLQTAERLAAHRARRARSGSLEITSPAASPPAETRASRIAAAVAERYAQSQSYRAFLAAEAQRAIDQAQAAVEVATRTAQAVADTQKQLLTELESWHPEPVALFDAAPLTTAPPSRTDVPRPRTRTAATLPATTGLEQPNLLPPLEQPASAQPIASAALTVRLYEDVARGTGSLVANAVPHESPDEEERLALEDEIAFRQAPSFDQFLEPAVPLPANLIEFPRQLVAPRKARPRLAEGPLREEGDTSQDNGQLRIFEVEADQISTQPSTESTLPEWSSIRLSACTVTEPIEVPQNLAQFTLALDSAPLGLRLMSATVDGCLILAGFLGFTTIFAYVGGTLPTGQIAALGAAGVLASLFLIYQFLFFTLSNSTPGMRYARIGLCTFGDENPTRAAMRRRVVAMMLAACPLGLGLAWACLDDERLGWHDRISRMYLRSY